MEYTILPNNRKVAGFGDAATLDVYKDVYEDEAYSRHGLSIESGAVVIDIGANIGLWSMFVMEKTPDVHVIAIEPIPQIFEALQYNIDHHKSPQSSVTALNIGFAAQEQTVKLNYYPKLPQLSSEVPFDADHFFYTMSEAKRRGHFFGKIKAWIDGMLWDWDNRPQTVICKMKTFSQTIEELKLERIDFVKLDAENAEWGVIAGISDKDWSKIQQMSIEVHTNIPGGQNLVEEINTLLRTKGFTVHVDFESRFSPVGVHMMYAKKQGK